MLVVTEDEHKCSFSFITVLVFIHALDKRFSRKDKLVKARCWMVKKRSQRKSRKESTTNDYAVNFLSKFIIVFANDWQKGSFCQDIRYGSEDNYLGLLPNDSRMHLLEQGSLCFVQL